MKRNWKRVFWGNLEMGKKEGQGRLSSRLGLFVAGEGKRARGYRKRGGGGS